jgi:putative Holliday junction resolvase
MDGSYGPQAEKSRKFGAALEAAGIAVLYWDERLTTVEAQRYLRDAGMRSQKRRQSIDAAAAAILLQSYLDYRRRV